MRSRSTSRILCASWPGSAPARAHSRAARMAWIAGCVVTSRAKPSSARSVLRTTLGADHMEVSARAIGLGWCSDSRALRRGRDTLHALLHDVERVFDPDARVSIMVARGSAGYGPGRVATRPLWRTTGTYYELENASGRAASVPASAARPGLGLHQAGDHDARSSTFARSGRGRGFRGLGRTYPRSGQPRAPDTVARRLRPARRGRTRGRASSARVQVGGAHHRLLS